MAEWNILRNEANIKLMSETLKISQITANVLANRNIRSKLSANEYLNPVFNSNCDTPKLKGVEKAAKIIAKALQKNVKIIIYGDYDADGIMSTVILYKMLKGFGADVSYYIPHREEEGYGLNINAVEKIHSLGCKLIITCDNGIAASKEVARARELEMAVIIIDHHEPPFSEQGGIKSDILPPAHAVIDPKQSSCAYPFKHMCAAGLSFKFAEYFYKRSGKAFDYYDEFIILAAIATYCDIVDLTGENRVIAKTGIQLLNSGVCPNTGLNALIKEKNLSGKPLGSFEIGFVIGPCINATGRISHAKTAVELFTASGADEARLLAKTLSDLNEERKQMTNKAFEKAVSELENSEFSNDKVLVLFMPEVHESVMGIVAGKVKEQKNRPSIILSRSGALAKGSARSIEQYHIFEELYKCKDLFERFGGHAMAAGLSMEEKNIPILRERLNNSCTLKDEDFVKIIDIEKEILFSDVTYGLAKELELLEPSGKGNPVPVFCTYGVYADQIDIIGESKKTLRFIFNVDNIRKLTGICFNGLDSFMENLRKKYSQKVCDSFLAGDIKKLTVKMDIAYNIIVNEFNGNLAVQIRIADFKF